MTRAESLYERLDLHLLKRMLCFASAALIPLVFVDAIWVHLIGAKTLPPAPIRSSKISIIPEDKYLEALSKGGLFGIPSSGAPSQVLKASAAELAKDYRLQGVILGADPEAIVQDVRSQKTMFVRVGEPLGELTVQDIRDGAVVLDCQGEQITLQIR